MSDSLRSSAVQDPAPNQPADETSFAETAMKLSGKSAEEARRMGAVDKADDQVEQMFAARFQTVNSPIHKSIWDKGLPTELFNQPTAKTPSDVQQIMDRSLDVVRRHRQAGALLDGNKK